MVKEAQKYRFILRSVWIPYGEYINYVVHLV